MSDWFRAREKGGEKPAPVRARSIQVPASLAVVASPPPAPSDEDIIIRVRSELLRVEAALGAKSGPFGNHGARQELKRRKAELLGQLLPLKKRIKEQRVSKSLDESIAYAERHGGINAMAKACALLSVLRSIVMDIDDQGPADKEAVRNAGAFLKEQGFLP